MRALLNFLFYQAAWFASILGAANGLPFLGVGVCCLVVGRHLLESSNRSLETRLIFLTGVTGAAWESILVQEGWVHYASTDPNGLPVWILTLWLAFATTLNHSLSWLKSRLWLSALFGLIGGPLAWWGGMHLGALTLTDPTISLTFIGLGWAVIVPFLFLLAGRDALPTSSRHLGGSP